MSHPNPSTALAAVLVDELVRNGVTRLVLGPGSRSAALAMSAASHPGMTVHVEIDERSAGFFALGVGRAGGIAAVLTTSGTAAANLLPAVIEADLTGIPLLVLTADRPPELRHAGANQTIDQIGLYGGAARWFCEVGVPEDRPGSNTYWRSLACQAVAASRGLPGSPGPVHLNLAFREPLVPEVDDGRSSSAPFEATTAGRPGGAPWAQVHAVPDPPGVPLPDGIAGLERVVVVAGPGGPARSAAELARMAGWPLIADGASGVRHPGSVSTAHHLLSHEGFAGAHRPEAAIVFGPPPASAATGRWLRTTPRLITVDPYRRRDPDRLATDVVAGVAVWPGDDPRPPGRWARSWLEAEEIARRALDPSLDALAEPSEPRTARDTAASVPEGATLVVASSMPVRDLDGFMAPRRIAVVANRGASGIDGFVSTTLGVASALDGPVTALAGDLSMLHDSAGLLVEPRPAAVFVVVNNDGGGIFSFLPQARFPESFEQVFGTPHGRSMERLAALYDVGHRRIERPGDLIPAIVAAREAGGVQIVEVVTDRDENVRAHRDLTAAVHRALDGAL